MAEETKVRAKLELVGEAQYRAAMADINRQLKETKTALAAAAAEYQNEDAAMRTNAAQVEALNRSLEQQRERYATMEEHLKKVNEVYGENSKQAVELRTKMNNARAEMAKTQTQLRGLTDGLEGAAQAGEAMGGGADSAQAAMARIGDAAQGAQDDVRDLAGEIGDVVGKKFIEFGLGKEVLSQLANGVKWAFGEAMDGMREDAHNRALTGDDALSERRAGMKDKLDRNWAGRMDGMQTLDALTAMDTALGNMGITDDARVTELTNWAITLQQVFGLDTQSTINRTIAMVNTFGESWETVFDLTTKGMRDMSDGGEQMLGAFEKYGPVYKQLGYDIDDMYSAIAAAANDKTLGKDNNLNKGVENLIKNLTSGSKESKETLKALGAEITDLPGKFQEGGDAAALAIQTILNNLLAVTDEAKRNDLGKALFGDTIWIDSAGKIADVILSGYDQVVDASGATADAMAAELDNIDDALAQLKERGNQAAGAVMAPLLEGMTGGLQEVNRIIDEETDGTVTGILSKFQEISDESDRQENKAINQWFDGLVQGFEAKMQRATQGASEAMSAATDDLGAGMDDLIAELEGIDERITAAWRSGNDAEAMNLEGRKQELIEQINSMATDVSAEFTGMGTDAAAALEDTSGDMRTAGETLAGEAVGAVTDAQGDMQDAGDMLGGEGVTGLEEGLEGMIGASADAVNGAVAELYRGTSRAYAAGQATGRAYVRGYKNELAIASPSRVMRLAAQYSVEGLLEGYDEGESEAAARGAAIAEAFNSAYTGRSAAYAGAGDAQDDGPGISAGVLAEAVREALSGAGVYLDGQRVGELTAPGVSAGIARSAAATVRGRSSRIKGW